MTTQPLDNVGSAVQHWDAFYNEHYLWVSQIVSSVYPSRKDHMTECVFTKVFFKNPSIIAQNDGVRFRMLVATLFPELAAAIHASAPKAEELMNLYYCPN